MIVLESSLACVYVVVVIRVCALQMNLEVHVENHSNSLGLLKSPSWIRTTGKLEFGQARFEEIL